MRVVVDGEEYRVVRESGRLVVRYYAGDVPCSLRGEAAVAWCRRHGVAL